MREAIVMKDESIKKLKKKIVSSYLKEKITSTRFQNHVQTEPEYLGNKVMLEVEVDNNTYIDTTSNVTTNKFQQKYLNDGRQEETDDTIPYISCNDKNDLVSNSPLVQSLVPQDCFSYSLTQHDLRQLSELNEADLLQMKNLYQQQQQYSAPSQNKYTNFNMPLQK